MNRMWRARRPAVGVAAVVSAWGEPLELREYPVTAPPPGGLLVEVERATVCGSDIHVWTGALAEGYGLQLPVILGHETVGRVLEGGGVDAVGRPIAAGDRVTWAHEDCGKCFECTVLRQGPLCPNRRMGFLVDADEPPHFHAGFAQYAHIAPGAGRLRIPDDVRSEWAAAASCGLRTIVDAMGRLGPVDHRHSVVIQGSGPLGLFGAAMIAVHRPKRVIVIGGPAARLDVAREWGADLTIDIDAFRTPEARLAAVLEATDGRGPDVVLELSGAPGAIGEGLQMAAPAARYVVAGTVGGGIQEIEGSLIVRKALTVLGSVGAEIGAYHVALEFLRAHRHTFDWDRLIGDRYSLEDATTALRRMRSGAETKAVIVPAGI
jgi:L-iditol 2-dehydrogenase